MGVRALKLQGVTNEVMGRGLKGCVTAWLAQVVEGRPRRSSADAKAAHPARERRGGWRQGCLWGGRGADRCAGTNQVRNGRGRAGGPFVKEQRSSPRKVAGALRSQRTWQRSDGAPIPTKVDMEGRKADGSTARQGVLHPGSVFKGTSSSGKGLQKRPEVKGRQNP